MPMLRGDWRQPGCPATIATRLLTRTACRARRDVARVVPEELDERVGFCTGFQRASAALDDRPDRACHRAESPSTHFQF
jgi:hypothetical protein